MCDNKDQMTEIKRKGARSIKEIPASVLEQLNRGEIESANQLQRKDDGIISS